MTSGRVESAPDDRTPSWLRDRVAIAAAAKAGAPFHVAWVNENAIPQLVLASNQSATLKLVRPPSTFGPVRLSLITSQSMPKVNGQPNPNLAVRAEKPVELSVDPAVKSAADALAALEKQLADAVKQTQASQADAKAAAEAMVQDLAQKKAAAETALREAETKTNYQTDFAIVVPAVVTDSTCDVSVRAELLNPERNAVLRTVYAPIRRLPVLNPLVIKLAGPSPIETTLDPKSGATIPLADEAGAIAGYYTLATGQVDFAELPAEVTTRLPRRLLPVAVLAWLGVSAAHRHRGLGRLLLAQALSDCYEASKTFAFIAVILDCTNDATKRFYQQWDFEELPGHPYRLFLSAKRLDAMMAVTQCTRGQPSSGKCEQPSGPSMLNSQVRVACPRLGVGMPTQSRRHGTRHFRFDGPLTFEALPLMNIPTTRVRGVTYLLVLMSCSLASSRLHADESRPDRSPAGNIQVAPSSLRLKHYRHWVSMTVSGRTADGIALDLTPEATIRSGDETIAIVEDGWVRPIKSGETTINVQAAGQTVEIPVHVELPPTERPYSFQHDVMPVLSKAGCNSGACHGYSLGKGGFKLSLRGGDALLDYQAVVGDAFGRRLNPLRPRESLVLKKPIGDIPHRGGIRFERGSLGAEILQHWIEQGAKGDLEDKVATSC